MKWLVKKISNINGLVCSVLDIDGIPYNDFCELFGQPHEIEKNKSSWLFELFNGIKIQIRYNEADYVIRRMNKLNLRSHSPVKIEDVDYLSIMGDTRYTVLFCSYLKSLFSLSLEDKDRIKSIKAVFGDAKY